MFVISALLSLIVNAAHAEEGTAASTFEPLFDGKSLEGWDGDPRFWRVEHGVIVGETTAGSGPEQNTFLIHRGGEFGDFELRLSYQVEGFNSGVQYRSLDQGNWVVSGYQCDFEARWHKSKQNPTAPPVDKFTGMFFDEKGRMFMGQRGDVVIVRTNPTNAKKPLIERIGSVGDPLELESHINRNNWNELVVIAKGNQFIHIINGHVMSIGIDEDKANRREAGLFAFQLHKGPPMKIRLKDIRVRRLSTRNVSEANASPFLEHEGSSHKNDVRTYQEYALRHAGSPVEGKKVFDDKRTKCAVCHRIAGNGGNVGVDLSRIGGKFDRPHLIESLLEPSRQIVEGFRTTSVSTVDGKVVSGIVKQQSSQQVVIVDADARTHVIARGDIDELSQHTVSIMPAGLTKELTLEEFTDLIAYLESLGAGNAKWGGGAAGPISIPSGFDLQSVVTGLDGATALEVLPDGRVLICEQPGQVRVVENDKLLKEPFVTLPVDAYWERGVIGVTCDPEFPKKPYIYVCWVAKEPYPHHRVSRFTMKDNAAIEGSESLLLVGDDQTKMGGKVPAGHQGGALHFGKDGKLYIGIGEQTSGAPAQKLDTFLGKILRINPDGSIPTDNPFVNKAEGKYRAIWAYGARNPFTFAVRKSDGLMLINDVGGETEEINVGRAGANYGWPVVEHGNMPQYKSSDYDGPIHHYPQSSLNGGDFCAKGNSWPHLWQGRYFFADFVQGWIHSLDPDNPSDVNTFIDGIRQPVDMRFAPDGSLYVLLRNAWVIDGKFQEGTGSLLRIKPNGIIAKTQPISAGKIMQPESSSPQNTSGTVVLTDDANDESANGLPAFKIETPSATYFLEKKGGGLSSLIDRDGNDWLGFHPQPGSKAGGEYRGFPNAVHKQGGSYFHAFNAHVDAVQTKVERADPGYVSIIAESNDGKWRSRYEFFATHCTFTVIKKPVNKKYWVLYEGVPGGEFKLNDWWMTSATKYPQPMSKQHAGDIPEPEWIAFGDAGGARSIVLLNHEDDDYPDSFYQMDRKMTVFGFGRQRLDAFHSKVGQRFSIALVESGSHAAISNFVDGIAKHLDKGAEVSPATSFSETQVATDHVPLISLKPVEEPGSTDSKGHRSDLKLRPHPGDVYREYAIHNGGNLDWRVTDPNAKHKGAQAFLPNPILNLNVRDLKGAVRAEAVLDRWGGHAGTKEKLIRFNRNDWITLPELTTIPAGHDPARYHSQDNPVVAIPLDHLQEGDNVLEGMIGPKNKTGWGQWGLYSLILRVYYDPQRKEHSTGKIVSPVPGTTLGENPTIKLKYDHNAERIDLLASYDGYDEDGNGVFHEWHGTRFQPFRGKAADLQNHVGTINASAGETELVWKTRWIPDQQPKAIRLIARVHSNDDLIFVTDTVESLSLRREGVSVKQYRAIDVPEAFSVRVGRAKSCNIPFPANANLDSATEAVLHYRTWEAYDGHHEPFQLNGHPHLNNGKNHHYDYDLLPIPIAELKTGDNLFTIHSETEHHMLEVLWPGPAITVRYQTE